MVLNRILPEPMLTKFYEATWHHYVTVSEFLCYKVCAWILLLYLFFMQNKVIDCFTTHMVWYFSRSSSPFWMTLCSPYKWYGHSLIATGTQKKKCPTFESMVFLVPLGVRASACTTMTKFMYSVNIYRTDPWRAKTSCFQRIGVVKRAVLLQSLISVFTLARGSGATSCGFTDMKSNWNMSRSDCKCFPVHKYWLNQSK